MPDNNSCCNGLIYVPLTINKTNSETGLGLAGAVFEMTDQNGFSCSGTTDANGLLVFYVLLCNTFTLREISPPVGYAPNEQEYSICADACCCIFVDGVSACQINIANSPIARSEPPLIDILEEESDLVTGLGIAGCTVTVIFPNGETATTVVAFNGAWSVPVPLSITLIAGDVISAYQTCAPLLPSNTTEATVVAVVLPTGTIDWENLTSSGNFIQTGDELEFFCSAANFGTLSSIWRSAVATIKLSDITMLLPGTVTINGIEITEGTGTNQYIYDSVANTLTFFLGDIPASDTVFFGFRVIVGEIPPDLDELVLYMILRSQFGLFTSDAIVARPLIT